MVRKLICHMVRKVICHMVRKVFDSQAYWTKSMTNSFCYCLLPLEHGSGPGPKYQGYVVDPAMKDSFLAAVDEVFVGPAYQLVALLQLVCAELAACFQGRWLSPSFHDVAAPAVAPSPAIAGSNLTSTCHSRASLANHGPDVSGLAAFRAACAQMLRPSVAGPQQQASSQAHEGSGHSTAAEAVIMCGPALISAGITVAASSTASQALLVLRGFTVALQGEATATVLPGSSVQPWLQPPCLGQG
ncbi:uncharacterized protein HaLaN_07255 [Haematococcus lacustris]|uniref:Uncharacterized protein n=1 Tax=Haematococcus lacustris TaxID=44745 RepID=A0A699YP14_HAELA|nr:uncharacterized protein HaLaN_07255 [Haematococcus lacustris]